MVMPSLPPYASRHVEDNAGRVDCLASGTTDVWGSWTEIVTATSVDTTMLHVSVGDPGVFSTLYYQAQIGIGSAGSEQIIIPYLIAGNTVRNVSEHFGDFHLPLSVPAGTRIAGRAVTSGNGTSGARLGVDLLPGRADALSQMAAAGVVYGGGDGAANRTGVSVVPVSNYPLYGAWAEVTSATDREHHIWTAHIHRLSDTSGQRWDIIQIGVGPAGSEQPVTVFEASKVDSSYASQQPMNRVLYFSVPSGARVAARAKFGAASGNGGVRLTLVGY